MFRDSISGIPALRSSQSVVVDSSGPSCVQWCARYGALSGVGLGWVRELRAAQLGARGSSIPSLVAVEGAAEVLREGGGGELYLSLLKL